MAACNRKWFGIMYISAQMHLKNDGDEESYAITNQCLKTWSIHTNLTTLMHLH